MQASSVGRVMLLRNHMTRLFLLLFLICLATSLVAQDSNFSLEMRLDAIGDCLEALALNAAARCTQSGEVELFRADVARVAQRIGFNDHLIEGHVPTDFELLAVAHVINAEILVALVQGWISRFQECANAPRSDAGRHLV